MPGLENWGVEYCQDWKIGGFNTGRIGGLKILPGRVAQIVGTWERRSEEVETERGNGRERSSFSL